MNDPSLAVGIRDFVAILDKIQASYCLIGGLAIVVRAYERTTKDIDFAILVDSNGTAEDLIRKIRAYDYEVFSLLENNQNKLISTVRLESNKNKIIVDLLFNSCGIEKEIISTATEVEIIDSVHCKVASLPALIAMKILSSTNEDRLQDTVDLQYLIKEANEEQLTEAKDLIQLIEEREFNAGVDLETRYDMFKKKFLK